LDEVCFVIISSYIVSRFIKGIKDSVCVFKRDLSPLPLPDIMKIFIFNIMTFWKKY
jgi:hypothetical protein